MICHSEDPKELRIEAASGQGQSQSVIVRRDHHSVNHCGLNLPDAYRPLTFTVSLKNLSRPGRPGRLAGGAAPDLMASL